MKIKGGYKIIDFENNVVVEESKKINGLYDKFNKTDKPIIITNLIVDDSGVVSKIKEAFATILYHENSTSYQCVICIGDSTWILNVDSDDNVNIV